MDFVIFIRITWKKFDRQRDESKLNGSPFPGRKINGKKLFPFTVVRFLLERHRSKSILEENCYVDLIRFFSPTSQAISKKFVSWSPKTFLRRDGTKMALRIFPPWRNVFFSFLDLGENNKMYIKEKQGTRKDEAGTRRYIIIPIHHPGQFHSIFVANESMIKRNANRLLFSLSNALSLPSFASKRASF